MNIKAFLLMLVIWAHISILDLMYIGGKGLVVLWQENSRSQTLMTHLSIALLTMAFYLLIQKLQKQVMAIVDNRRLMLGSQVNEAETADY